TRRELDLDYSRIKAELDGRVGRAMMTAGNLVNAGGSDPLLTLIVAVDPIHVYFSVDAPSLVKYRARHADRQYDVSADDEADEDAQNGTEAPEGSKGAGDEKPRQNVVKDLQIPVEFGLDTDKGYPHRGTIDFAD